MFFGLKVFKRIFTCLGYYVLRYGGNVPSARKMPATISPLGLDPGMLKMLKPVTETETLASPAETEARRLYVMRRYRDVKIGLHVIMIADVNLFSRPLIMMIIIHNVNLQGAITWSLLQGHCA